MKIYLDDNSNYIEIKKHKNHTINFSIRAGIDNNKESTIITASLDEEAVDNIIATLIALKADLKND